MITEEICTYEVCKLAKEKGFNLPSYFYYCREELSNDGYFCCHNKGADYVCTAPTQALLQRWLREEKGIIVEVIAQPTCSTPKKNCYWWSVKRNSDGFCYQYEECSYILYSDEGYFNSYELALEDGLAHSLKNLI